MTETQLSSSLNCQLEERLALPETLKVDKKEMYKKRRLVVGEHQAYGSLVDRK